MSKTSVNSFFMGLFDSLILILSLHLWQNFVNLCAYRLQEFVFCLYVLYLLETSFVM